MDPSHILHSSYFNNTLRKWQSNNTEITPYNLVLPIFVIDSDDAKEEISSMPGVYHYGINRVKEFLDPIYEIGLKSVLLFGVINKLPKSANGHNADSSENPVIRTIPLLKSLYPNLTIVCDVCLCAYTSHGHCGILREDGSIDNLPSISRIGKVAQSYALAGADVVAPSDMMDGRVSAIKQYLSEVSLLNKVAVLSYSVKFDSCFYGPFRHAANSAPSFGNRKSYQIPPGSKGLSFLSAQRDVNEGADFLMVKPGLSYLDIVKQTKDSFPHHPLFIYQVSGEYSMLYHAAKNGVFNLRLALKEILTSMRRAGADCIITYFTPDILQWINNGDPSERVLA